MRWGYSENVRIRRECPDRGTHNAFAYFTGCPALTMSGSTTVETPAALIV